MFSINFVLYAKSRRCEVVVVRTEGNKINGSYGKCGTAAKFPALLSSQLQRPPIFSCRLGTIIQTPSARRSSQHHHHSTGLPWFIPGPTIQSGFVCSRVTRSSNGTKECCIIITDKPRRSVAHTAGVVHVYTSLQSSWWPHITCHAPNSTVSVRTPTYNYVYSIPQPPKACFSRGLQQPDAVFGIYCEINSFFEINLLAML